MAAMGDTGRRDADLATLEVRGGWTRIRDEAPTAQTGRAWPRSGGGAPRLWAGPPREVGARIGEAAEAGLVCQGTCWPRGEEALRAATKGALSTRKV